MLDIKFIRDNAELVAKKAEQKGYKVNIDELIDLDNKRKKLIEDIDSARATRNEFAKQKGEHSDESLRNEAKGLKEKIKNLETELSDIENEYLFLLQAVPNVFPDDTPLGGEESNREEKKWGEPRRAAVKDHLAWGEERGLIDFERGAKVAGNKFYFLKGNLVELELATLQFALQLAAKHGFTPITVPHLVNTRTVSGTGFNARGDEQQIYKVENEDLNLIATAEIPITGYHADEILAEKDLPILYVGLSPAYRVEGGAYGKHNHGLFRTHQFNKMELYVFCKPEESETLHQKLVELEEEFCRALGIPYRLVRIAAGDLGAPAYKKYDIEYWSPADKTYRELMSCSNVTDYQARRLNIRYKAEGGKNEFVHTLNGTLAAMSRVPIALIENHQTTDGRVKIPEALRPFMAGKTEI